MNEEEKKLRKENQKKMLILTLIAIITLSLVAIGAAYAFFASQNTGKQDININAESGTTDVLSFSLEDKDVFSESIQDDENAKSEIMITANMTNFNQNNIINVGDGVTGNATLIANNATNKATEHYYVYLKIDTNTLKYTNFKNNAGEILEGKEVDGEIIAPDDTHTTKVPELILTVMQPDGKGELDHIDGLNHYTDVDGHELNGFDITEAKGLISIAENYEITAEGEEATVKTIQKWEIKVTLVNLDSNQNKNTNKEFTGQIIMQKEEFVPENVKSLFTAANKNGQTMYKLNTNSLTNQKVENAAESPNDNSYRYVGSSAKVNNYVCLDGTSTEGQCNSDSDLYRIIGMFPNNDGEYEMKLIKATAATVEELGDNETAVGGAYFSDNYYQWNSKNSTSGSNMWQYSNLNTVNLNDFYYNYITNKVSGLAQYIVKHPWVVGGINTNAEEGTIYDKELGKSKVTNESMACYDETPDISARQCNQENDITYEANIGLMYVSDYAYAATPENWSTDISLYGSTDITDNDWLFQGIEEWTITRSDSNSNCAWQISSEGYAYSFLRNYGVYVYDSTGIIRPSFYLSATTTIASGDGSKTNPFRIELSKA